MPVRCRADTALACPEHPAANVPRKPRKDCLPAGLRFLHAHAYALRTREQLLSNDVPARRGDIAVICRHPSLARMMGRGTALCTTLVCQRAGSRPWWTTSKPWRSGNALSMMAQSKMGEQSWCV